jgi:hypothetical protein
LALLRIAFFSQVDYFRFSRYERSRPSGGCFA